ncbi:MAG: glycosyltransferase family 4 protein [Oligoflexia bacterium]|nr:glycosyltransferase family 4 protein [Oligoflexia bacterium]
MTKILLCSANPLDVTLGAAKVLIEIAQSLNELGADCKLASDEEICPGVFKLPVGDRAFAFSRALRVYLKKTAPLYDVVDYDHGCLPYARDEFSNNTLFVARSVLLVQHFVKIKIPIHYGIKSWIKNILPNASSRRLNQRVLDSQLTLKSSDLINVSNTEDRDALMSIGLPKDKIVVIPFGLTHDRWVKLKNTDPSPLPLTDTIAFIGTFDLRKGSKEFPEIVSQVVKAIPHAKFKLLGAKYRNKEEILKYFPKKLHSNLDIVPEFHPQELPQHLSDCSIGIFPSYIEGFGFGVLEMLAAGLPVISYNSPGPTMMLPDDLMVPRGDHQALANKVIALLTDTAQLKEKRIWAHQRALDFQWRTAAQKTLKIYDEKLKILRYKKS